MIRPENVINLIFAFVINIKYYIINKTVYNILYGFYCGGVDRGEICRIVTKMELACIASADKSRALS